MKTIEESFRSLGRSEKANFISKNIDYANADVIAEYVRAYLFDVLKDVKDDEYVAMYLRENGYKVSRNE